MSCEHLDPLSLAGALDEDPDDAEVARKIATCPRCAEADRELRRWSVRLDHPNPLVACEVESAPALLEGLLALPSELRISQIGENIELQTWGLASLLLERSEEVRLVDLEASDDVLSLAFEIADHLDEEFYGRYPVASLRARAFGQAADIVRLFGEPRLTRVFLDKAWGWFDRGTREARPRSELLRHEAALAADLGKLDEARRTAARAVAFACETGNTEVLLRARLGEAAILARAGEVEAALAVHGELLPEVRAHGDRALRLVACHHLTRLLVGAAAETVARVLAELPAGEGLLALDQRWLATRLQHQRGDLAAAARSYRALRRSFLEGRLGWEAALVSLDLACLYFELGREELAQAVDAELCEVLVTDRELPAEAAGALLELLHRARRGELSHELVSEIRGRLLAAGGHALPRLAGVGEGLP